MKIGLLKTKNRKPKTSAGFTLMETLIAVAMTAVILAIFTSATSSIVFLRKAGYSIQAANFVREELDSLRTIPFSELINRVNGDFLALSLTRGPWKIKTVANPPSGTRVMAMETAQAALNHETALAVLPGNYHQDFDFTSKFNVLPSSPSGWGAAIAFDYRDPDNNYRFRFTNGGIALDKVYHGTATTLWSQSATYNTNTWYTLRVVTSGASITLYKNGVSLTTLADATFSTGDAALMTLDGALVYVDDVSLTENSVTASYDFDADAVGQMPTAWQRFAYFDLPDGSASLTIADYLGQSTIKQVTATVTWTDQGNTKTMTGTTLIAK